MDYDEFDRVVQAKDKTIVALTQHISMIEMDYAELEDKYRRLVGRYQKLKRGEVD